jgi:O-antigen/teichoic acid export membrane protein
VNKLGIRIKVNQLKVGAALSYISMGLGYIISIIYTPIMLRLLGQSEYGLYNLVASVVSYLGLLSFGFGSAYVRYYSRYNVKDEQENIAKLNGMFLIVFSIIGIIAVLAGTVLVLNVDIIFGNKLTAVELETSKTLMVIMVFNLALSFPANVFNSYITAIEQYIFQKIIQMLKTIVSPLVMLPVLLMGYKSLGMVVVTTLLTIIVELCNIIFCFKKLKMRFLFKQFNFDLIKEITVFSSYIFINMIIDQINWNLDKFIIGRFRGTVGVAVYGLAAQLNTYYMSLSTSISQVFIPRVHRMVAVNNDDGELTSLFTRIGRIQFILLSLICSGFMFLGRPFISMWAGTDYYESYPIALLLIIPVTIPLIQNIGIEIQRAKNLHKFRSWIYLFMAIGNIFLSIPLTKLYGGIGAAFGTALSILIGNGFVMNWYYNNRVGLDIKYFWSQILKCVPAFIAPTIVGVFIVLFINLYNPISFLICGLIYVIVFCVSMWYLGMNQYEKDLISGPVKKIFRKMKFI